MTPEKKIQNEIIKYLTKLEKTGFPIFFERRNAGSFNYKKGIPDLYVVVDGIHLEIEVKKGKDGKLSTMQEKFRDRCTKNNICWIRADSLQDVVNIVEAILKSH